MELNTGKKKGTFYFLVFCGVFVGFSLGFSPEFPSTGCPTTALPIQVVPSFLLKQSFSYRNPSSMISSNLFLF